METGHIITYVSSAALAFINLFFSESIKELIKRFFSIKTKKEIKTYYWVIFLLAISIPFIIFYFTSDKVNKAPLTVGEPTNLYQPTELKH